MNIYNKLLVTFISMSSMLLAGCSDSFEAFETPSTSLAPPTGIADQNSFTLARVDAAVEGDTFAGATTEVTVFAADRHNHPVPDDTIIRFLTNGGAIQQQCIIVDGTCSATWNSQSPRPESGIATVIAYTDGEESFLDLNDNDAFDAGEAFTDLPEPFIDEFRNFTFDVGSEEFVDRDGDNTFDPADGRYTGESCVGDNTVCNRTQLFVWDDVTIVMSTSFADITFSVLNVTTSALAVSAESVTPIVISVLDRNGNQMAVGTTIDIEVSNGTIDNTSFTVGNGAALINVNYTAPDAAGSDIMKVTVTSPESSSETVDNLPITIP